MHGWRKTCEWRALSLFISALVVFVSPSVFAALPDLRVNRPMLANTIELTERTFASGDCELDEGCARTSGNRRLMLFNVGIANVGQGDLVVGDPASKTNWFHFSTCHGHYHMTGFAVYRLKRLNGTVVVTSRKQGSVSATIGLSRAAQSQRSLTRATFRESAADGRTFTTNPWNANGSTLLDYRPGITISR